MMEEENYAVFEVCFVDEHADSSYCQNQRIIHYSLQRQRSYYRKKVEEIFGDLLARV